MNLKTPDFWYGGKTLINQAKAITLTPASWLYRAGLWLHRQLTAPDHIDVPVICIGNVNAGGAGKTPSARAMMALIKAQKNYKKPYFLMRGFGGQLQGPLVVDPTIHRPAHVGEEALLLAQESSVVIAKSRHAGALYAKAQGADIIVMDDGLQNRSLKPACNVLIVDGKMGWGNGKMLPAGPLREPLNQALDRIDFVMIVGADERGIREALPSDLPVLEAKIQPKKDRMPDISKAYYAFAGIGYPEKFFRYLKEGLNLNLLKTKSFPDHYPYNAQDIDDLVQTANANRLQLITTEKDFFHIQTHYPKADIDFLPIELAFAKADEERLLAMIDKAIKESIG